MRQQGGFFYWVKIIMILAIAIAGFFYTQKAWASGNILINEVLIKPTESRFIELYNPSSSSVDLTGWYLQRKIQGGTSFGSLVSKTNFAGKIISANGYFLISRVVAANADIVLSGLTLTESNTIQLKDSDGEIIDAAEWSLAPDDSRSLERKDDGNWQTSELAGGTPKALNSTGITPPPVCGNGQAEAGESCDDGNLLSGDGCGSVCQTETDLTPPSPRQDGLPTGQAGGQASQGEGNNTASSTDQAPPLSLPLSKGENGFGEVVINEFVSDPADNEVEWLELYNKTGREIDLTDWWLEDGGKTKTKLAGLIGLSDSGRYKIVEKPAGVLNNAGDLIVLYDGAGKIIDQAAYGNWPDGNPEDNAPAAHDPASLARKFDGYNTFNNANDFALTLKPTKGMGNIIQAEDEVSAAAKAKFDFSQDILISEILPNPTGDDAKSEFIEIYNAGRREVNLTGWSLSREDDKKVNLEKIATSSLIKAGEYLALFRIKTKIVLHNDLGQVKLFQPLAEKPLMAVVYKNVKEGWSYNLENPMTPLNPPLSGWSWEWSETPTPGAANAIKTVNHAPTVEFSLPKELGLGRPIFFDSSDTDDLDGDSLKFSWDFGDGFKNNLANPEHTFFKSGIYKVKLAVSDGQATTTAEKNVRVAASVDGADSAENDLSAETPLTPLLKGGEIPLNPPLLKGVIINEIFPNPAGADAVSEWAELKNSGTDKVNLLNWRLENSNGKYKFKNDLWLDAANFYLLTNLASRLAFKNESDAISLYNGLDELIDRVEYAEAVQGETYARGANGKWFWTVKMTPARENIINLSDLTAGRQGSQSAVLAKAPAVAGQTLIYIETTLEKIRELEIGSLVKVKGTVAVEPGILGVQIFYIVGSPAQAASSTAALLEADLFVAVFAGESAAAGRPGVQIYNYKKDFPALKVGDYIEVSGELAQSQAELRIKTKDKNDINLVEHKSAPLALAVKVDEINEENVGQLITVTGEITDKKAYTAYLDDGHDEILVYFKKSAGLDTKSLKAGQTVAVTGILSRTQTGLRLLPRYQADLVKIDQAAVRPQVLGETVMAEEWAVAERDKKLEFFKYLLIIAGGVIIILGILFVKVVRKK